MARPLRHRRFRSGDLAEGLGIELLKHLALVAPVPRAEDIGIDAYATLLRPAGDDLVAENNFLLQFKTNSTRRVPRRGTITMGWLRGLRMPFWIGSVNRETSHVSLYSTFGATRHPNAPDHSEVVLYLGGSKVPKAKDSVAHRLLRDPVFSFTAHEAASGGFPQRAYDTLKPVLDREQEHFGLLQDLNMLEGPRGETVFLHHPAQLRGQLEAIVPAIKFLSMLCVIHPARLHVGAALLVIGDFMREQGVDPDPAGILPTLLRHGFAKAAKKTT